MAQESGQLAGPPQKKGVTITWRGIVLVVIGVVLLVFAVQNLQLAEVRFLGADMQIWVWALVVVSFALGMVLGGVVKTGARKLRKPKPPQKA
jgi:uncharacterized integral membrane protein